ncbi:hypothetical protein [Caballeronia sp. TF1N1]|uniref:hypothetical protein n=1 Tax=Caballeronia sp. TF1N1 TaxID=2878153 RepID=UPI001FCFF669|nr:hypothetical protein [Caballeronia sp. TF1N1]
MTEADFVANLAMLLRDQPRFTTADLSDFAVAYWDQGQVKFVFLDDEGRCLDEGFSLNDFMWEEWAEQFSSWLKHPVFSRREELERWKLDAPPVESGI